MVRVDEELHIQFMFHYLRTVCFVVCKMLDVFTRKSAKKKIPTHIVNLLSKAELNDIYREESEGAQGSS